MEYAATASAPHTLQNCYKLEQVQRCAARFACHRYERTASVTAMMYDLKWESLETRLNNQRLTCFIVCNTTWCLLLQLMILFRFSGRTAEIGRDEMHRVSYTQTNVYKYSFFPATVRMWKTLLASLNHFHSLQSFKTGVSVYN